MWQPTRPTVVKCGQMNFSSNSLSSLLFITFKSRKRNSSLGTNTRQQKSNLPINVSLSYGYFIDFCPGFPRFSWFLYSTKFYTVPEMILTIWLLYRVLKSKEEPIHPLFSAFLQSSLIPPHPFFALKAFLQSSLIPPHPFFALKHNYTCCNPAPPVL